MEIKIRSVPFGALGGLFEADDVEAAHRVTSAAAGPGGSFFPLPEENEFQEALAAHEGAKCAVSVNACGTALDLCMMALDIRPGDEVITTPQTFVCTATCASARGARIVFADIDANTMCLDPRAVEAKITPRTRAIIPVHFAGHPADIDGFDRITEKTGIPVVYDAAHAVGATYKDQPLGGRGKASCYSFQSNKNITTLGEGGAVTTDDEAFAEAVRQRKTFGFVYGPKLRVATTGFNYRMTKPQLAVGLTQIAKVDRINELKRRAMQKLNELLTGIEGIILPAGINDDHAAHLHVLRVDSTTVSFSRDAFRAHLLEKYKVGTGMHYPIVWGWEAFAAIDHDLSNCPIADRVCSEVMSLPVFPDTSDEDLPYIAWAIRQTVEELG